MFQRPSPPRRGAAASAFFARALPALLLAGAVTGCALVDEEFDEGGGRPWVGEGGRVVGFSGSYSYQETDRTESEWFAARATIDQFLTDEHVIGAYALGQFNNMSSEPDGNEQLWGGLHYHYHLHLSERTSIYAGPSLGAVFFDDKNTNDSALTWGLSGGIRHWLTERVAVTVEPTYLRANFDTAAGGDSEEFLVLWGLAFSL
ncbi:hypothetical protein Poly30_16300 [Planctomycetes bacterium Poly30]|uniref:Outer membrane protein beta-barrel domain-containing protein n=1 Tax=Saltatorellus ferox TaxID=2528018 RepID=A0A518EPV8_9BACT|nr:hypothetical protein Poly30_16300 [Planctomycetes bacterium Poly30]